MVVARERAEDEAGAEVGQLSISAAFSTFQFFWGAVKNCLEFVPTGLTHRLRTLTHPLFAVKYFLQVGARLARMEAALAKLLARSEPANL